MKSYRCCWTQPPKADVRKVRQEKVSDRVWSALCLKHAEALSQSAPSSCLHHWKSLRSSKCCHKSMLLPTVWTSKCSLPTCMHFISSYAVHIFTLQMRVKLSVSAFLNPSESNCNFHLTTTICAYTSALTTVSLTHHTPTYNKIHKHTGSHSGAWKREEK